MREPPYYGGRGKACTLCSTAGDPIATICVMTGAFVAGLIVVAAIYIRFRFYSSDSAAQLAEMSGKLTSVLTRRDIKGEFIDDNIDRLDASGASNKTRTKVPLAARLGALAGSLGVKMRILISLIQVLTSLGDTCTAS